jgi:DNA-binding transcriptional LysR family regulator
VANIEAKIELQIAGLGYGFLPRCRIEAALKKRELVGTGRRRAACRRAAVAGLERRRGEQGEALKWWRARLQAADALLAA